MKRSKGLAVCGLIISILLVIFGAFTLTRPDTGLESAVIIYGVLAIAMGVLDIAVYVRLERRTGFGPVTALITGILSLIAGILFLLQPVAGALTLTWLFPIWFICHCVSRLANIGITRIVAGRTYYYFDLIINILGLIVGIMLCFNPLVSALTMSYMVGFYLIVLGIEGVVMAIEMLNRR